LVYLSVNSALLHKWAQDRRKHMAQKLISPADLPDYGITLGDRQRRTLEMQGRFPRRVQITERTYGYVEAEIMEMIEKKIEARNRAGEMVAA
jgi:hypothetical protein